MDGTITIGTELDTKEFDMQIRDLERKIAELENQISVKGEAGLDTESLHDAQLELEKTRNKLVQLRKEKQKLQDSKGIKSLVGGMNDFGNSISKAVTKIGKLALGIFGIRSAYLALRRASSDLASYDEQYATDLEYIRYVLTQAIAPVLKTIVSWTMQLLQLINGVVSGLFGINLFANGSAESFNQMKNNASGVSQAVKEIKKDLLGFDEINRLSSSSDTGTVAGALGVGMPLTDLSKISDNTTATVDKIKNKLLELLPIIGGIGAAIIALKIGSLLSELGLISAPMTTILRVATGIGITVAGIIYTLNSLIGYLNDPSWQNFGKVIAGIGVVVAGVAVAFGAWPIALAGAVVVAYGYLLSKWDEIRKWFNEKVLPWFDSKTAEIKKKFGIFGEYLWKKLKGWFEKVFSFFDNKFSSIKRLFDGVITFLTGVFSGDWDLAWQGLGDILNSWVDYFIKLFEIFFNFVWQGLTKITNRLSGSSISAVVDLFGLDDGKSSGWGFAKGGIYYPSKMPKLASGGIINVPRKRSTIQRSNYWRTWSRSDCTINRYTTNGIIRSNNWKIHNSKCKHSKHNEWQSNIERIKTSKKRARFCL